MLFRTATVTAAAALATVAVGTLTPTASAADRPPSSHVHARSSLPPGESGFFSAADQARYEADGKPSDFGPHVDDQRLSYWNFRTKPDGFATPHGSPVEPRTGVRIYRDSSGVPLIYGKTGYDVWYGAGYAAATDRLFEMDAIRRLGEGRLAELTGPSAVPADVQERTLTYTQREYDAMFHRLSKRGRDAIAGYAAGANARIQQVRNNPSLLPGEYALLSTEPAPWTVTDTLAAGVYITRNIASQGGEEMANVATLRELQHKYGRSKGIAVFQDLFPDDDPKAAVSISGRRFSNLPKGDRSPADQRRDFAKAIRYSRHIPLSLANGPGTGAYPAPSATSGARSTLPPLIARELRQAAAAVNAWGAGRHGGSFAYAISGRRTANHHAMVVSNPQLAYSYPSELYELEVHGDGYDARGVGVPSIPTVGIGHTGSVAWALTTGYSKTIDSFIETTRRRHGVTEYKHRGGWHPERCHNTTVKYRATGPEGLPVGPDSQSVTVPVCRTDHGPVVATTKNGRHARAVDYAQWKHDVDTVAGILRWDRATSLRQVTAGVKHVEWNENIIAADDKGHIGFWHPGRYFRRSKGIDQRFPLKGNGSQDERGFLPYRRMPHVIDPKAGYVANWNTKPAHGWVDGDLSGSNTRPGGPANRVRVIQTLLAARHHVTAAGLGRIDRRIGESDDRFLGYRPIIRNLVRLHGLSKLQRQAARLLRHYDGRAYAPGAKGGSSPLGTPASKVTDGPAATLFVAYTQAVKQLLFGRLPADVRARLDTLPTDGHRYDVTPLDNEALRVLRPGFSGLTPLSRWAHGRSRSTIERAALRQAVRTMQHEYGAKPASWRRHHAISAIDSLSGVIGPSETMPFEDRGTWVQEAAFSRGRPR